VRCSTHQKLPRSPAQALRPPSARGTAISPQPATPPRAASFNDDSVGIELVGKVLSNGVYDAVTSDQNNSLGWLVSEIQKTLGVPVTEVFRHPDVSRKNPTVGAVCPMVARCTAGLLLAPGCAAHNKCSIGTEVMPPLCRVDLPGIRTVRIVENASKSPAETDPSVSCSQFHGG